MILKNSGCRIKSAMTYLFLFFILLFSGTVHASIGTRSSKDIAGSGSITGNTFGSSEIIPDLLPVDSQNSAASKEIYDSNDTGVSSEKAIISDDMKGKTITKLALTDTTDTALSGTVSTATTGEPSPPDINNNVLMDFAVKSLQVKPTGNSGAALTNIPIIVPPGRKGIEPRISLNYSSSAKNGWIGVGWSLDMGAIQRSTKRGVDYSGDDFVVTVNGSSSELVYIRNIADGVREYSVKIEGEFSRYIKYFDNDDDGWVVTAKDGTKYFYGRTSASRQDNGYGTFKWCLNRVEDTNGNYMTISYFKDQGEIYLDRIDYTGNTKTGLNPSNYVEFKLNWGHSVPVMYTTNSRVLTNRPLSSIDVYSNGQYPNGTLVRKYNLAYNETDVIGQWLLNSVTLYGNQSGYGITLFTLNYTPEGDGHFSAVGNNTSGWGNWQDGKHFSVGDYNGDGKTDWSWYAPGTDDFIVMLSNGDGHFSAVGNNTSSWGNWQDARYFRTGDYNGDGKTDWSWYAPWSDDFIVMLSTGDGHYTEVHNNAGEWDSTLYAGVIITTLAAHFSVGDFNGDGRTDWSRYESWEDDFIVMLSNGDGTYTEVHNNTSGWGDWKEGRHFRTGDYNGDGMTDWSWYAPGTDDFIVMLSNGDGHFSAVGNNTSSWGNWQDGKHFSTGDYNGDGKTDWSWYAPWSDNFIVMFSTGDGKFAEVHNDTSSWGNWQDGKHFSVGDYNGDGKTDWSWYAPWSDDFIVMNSTPLDKPTYLLESITNYLGATTTIEYEPSSTYTNKFLPFIVQTLSKVTIDDGNGNLSKTTYTYENGYFDYDDRSFWGFEYVKATAQNGTYTETWFNNDDYVFKGLLLEQVTTDSSGYVYTRTVNTYGSKSIYTDVVFPYLSHKEDYLFDGITTDKNAVSYARRAKTEFWYEDAYGNTYGNITRKYFHGDLADPNDQRDEYTEYYLPGEIGDWIVSLPKHTYVKDNTGATKAQTWFTYYTGTGNLWTEKKWLDTGPDPVTTYEDYDDYGNVKLIRDPRGNLTEFTYDTATHTNPVEIKNALNHTTNMTYDPVFIGKVKTEKDANGNMTTYEYDEFGRIKKVTNPNDTGSTYGTISYFYENFGTVGSQKVKTYATEQSGTGNHIWSETYFDGLGRTIKTESEGHSSKVIVTKTEYNNRGLVYRKSLPYFKNEETARWTTYEYDPIGRITKTTYHDGTDAKSDYLKGTLTSIDPNRHKKVAVKDIYGRIIEIQEYTGDEASGFTLYATTTYDYDVLGNLTYVRDEAGNETNITYDSLSRKNPMDDPDMGHWEYDYDANGNLTYQKDAKNQEITFQYDALNRIEKKIYPDASFIEYKYDETFSTNYKGRLTTLTDASGTTKFYYDKLGNTIKTIKTIDSSDYITETTYDALGRTDTLTYPDSTVIKYVYDAGGNLYQVKDNSSSYVYITYSNYNALGQYRDIAFGNGVTTQYQYYPNNNRLYSITTNSPTAGLLNLSYEYDNVGNITKINDYMDSTKTRTFVYDELNRLEEADSPSYGGKVIYQYDKIGNITYNCKYGYYFYEDPNHVHAVTRIEKNGQTIDSYTYDANGNMESGAGRTFSYDYDNRPTSITYNSMAVVSVYDAGGQRVKKVTPTSTITYIGNVYECKDGNCTKYIFAGSQRIAKTDSSDTYFYHSDHLGSSSVLTDASANTVQEIYYYPYGQIKTNTGSDIAKHKFTGQEYDAETGLYYYNARYYDPRLARFISADTIVPDPLNPQALNRYSYVLNNPLKYIDPSGNFWEWFLIGALIGGVSAEANGGDFLEGAFIGAVSGAVGGLAGSYAASAASSAGYSATVSSVVAGSAGGAAGGATNSALYGGNIGQGALIGMFAGGAGGYVGYATQGWSDASQGLAQVGTGGLIGGTVSELTGGTFGDGFSMGALSGAVAFGTSKAIKYLGTRPMAEAEAAAITKEHGLNKIQQWPGGEDKLTTQTTDVSALRNKLQVVHDKYKMSSIWSKSNQVRIGRYDAKFYNDNTQVTIHNDTIDVRINPIGHLVRDKWNLFN